MHATDNPTARFDADAGLDRPGNLRRCRVSCRRGVRSRRAEGGHAQHHARFAMGARLPARRPHARDAKGRQHGHPERRRHDRAVDGDRIACRGSCGAGRVARRGARSGFRHRPLGLLDLCGAGHLQLSTPLRHGSRARPARGHRPAGCDGDLPPAEGLWQRPLRVAPRVRARQVDVRHPGRAADGKPGPGCSRRTWAR